MWFFFFCTVLKPKAWIGKALAYQGKKRMDDQVESQSHYDCFLTSEVLTLDTHHTEWVPEGQIVNQIYFI